ncbi:hypothetical protein [Lutibacter sp.]|uniref:hypothetical protein n=1 Tax=Lutibacter sp. TaxID=1925666 RepID=UPI0025C07B90|nr:hypothetical protein [Lutibacter sp.]MCF6182731.1 hypothetical protein [Lutibacter sp.]
MAYKILYIDDLDTKSREKDIESLGYEVKLYNPTSNISDLFEQLEEFKGVNASVLDYRLTKGDNNACFDAPTLAQTLRTKHKEDLQDFPLVLMSNEDIKIAEYDKDLTSQDLFDFVLTKQEFSNNMSNFKKKLNSFIKTYETIKLNKFDLTKILNIDDESILHSRIKSNTIKIGSNIFMLSNFLYYEVIRPIGVLIGEDVLSARLGVSKESNDWDKLLESIKPSFYTGIFSDYHNRWWMDKINKWWNETITPETSLRRLNADERVGLLKDKLGLKDLIPLTKTKHAVSSNFWTICKNSKEPIDPFDGIELLKEYHPWQEKEYFSIDSALAGKTEVYKNQISAIDKKAIRELVKKERVNG